MMMPPRATVRLQLQRAFTLDDAAAQVPYYARLGISHFYLSPITRARPGSPHGYDVVDHSAINPELGGEAALRRLVATLRQHGMGLIADIVPNHMAADSTNSWWRDVLEHGPASHHAAWFDIDWNPPDTALRGKVLAPWLAQSYGASLAAGDIALVYDEARDCYEITTGVGRFPLAPGTRPIGASPRAILDAHATRTEAGRLRLHRLLERQHYRLAWWRTAADQINWRRFFDISALVGVRVEFPAVFDAVHALILRLYGAGLLDGVRIDHVDGLADPIAYCDRLRAALRSQGERRSAAGLPRDPYMVVEKILAPDETLDGRWPVDGTTGYDFMDQVSAMLHAPTAQPMLAAAWQDLSLDARPVGDQLEAARHRMLTRHFVAERRSLVHELARLARLRQDTRDWTEDAIDRVLTPWLVAFTAYRTYAGPEGRSAADETRCQRAAVRARQRLGLPRDCPGAQLLDQVNRWLDGSAPPDTDPRAVTVGRRALRKFQQLTPPLAAKALEDTLFYRYGPLLSRNEVGASPTVFALAPAAFHQRCAARARLYPAAMLATATHDHKRGEDTRARLAVLSEMPAEWLQAARPWLAGLPPSRAAPDTADRYLLLQTLVGAWPVDLAPDDMAGLAAFLDRIRAWQRKALREAKLRTSWTSPDTAYEAACDEYLDGLADSRGHGASVLARIGAFARQLAPAGMINSLAQTLLRMTTPGVPDLYQGADFWDFSLVDPDNRRPVNYATRRAALDALASTPLSCPGSPATSPTPVGADLSAWWRSGHVKQTLIHLTLALRAARPLLFAHGAYQPLAASGRRATHVLAFTRSLQDQHVLVVVPRLCARQLAGHAAHPASPVPAFWENTRVSLPTSLRQRQWRDALHGGLLPAGDQGGVALAHLLARHPVGLYVAA